MYPNREVEQLTANTQKQQSQMLASSIMDSILGLAHLTSYQSWRGKMGTHAEMVTHGPAKRRACFMMHPLGLLSAQA